MKRNYAEWKDKFAAADGLRIPVFNAIGYEWMSQSEIASKIGTTSAKISEVMSWIRRNQQVSIEVWERIDKPTLYRRKV
jgi:hypothetical protein